MYIYKKKKREKRRKEKINNKRNIKSKGKKKKYICYAECNTSNFFLWIYFFLFPFLVF